jgi:hypothetical protein
LSVAAPRPKQGREQGHSSGANAGTEAGTEQVADRDAAAAVDAEAAAEAPTKGPATADLPDYATTLEGELAAIQEKANEAKLRIGTDSEHVGSWASTASAGAR